MTKRSLFQFLAAGLTSAMLFAVSVPAGADTVVLKDSGGSSSDVHGTATGATIDSNSYADTITTINDSSVLPGLPFPLSFSITVTSTPFAGITIVTGGFGSKDIGDPLGLHAHLDFVITSGNAQGSHFNMDGTITAVTVNTLPGYDFSMLVGGLISIANDQAGTDFTTVLNHAGVDATASGFGMHEIATVPEPTSMALLGIGISGFFAFRRFFKRTSVA